MWVYRWQQSVGYLELRLYQKNRKTLMYYSHHYTHTIHTKYILKKTFGFCIWPALSYSTLLTPFLLKHCQHNNTYNFYISFTFTCHDVFYLVVLWLSPPYVLVKGKGCASWVKTLSRCVTTLYIDVLHSVLRLGGVMIMLKEMLSFLIYVCYLLPEIQIYHVKNKLSF